MTGRAADGSRSYEGLDVAKDKTKKKPKTKPADKKRKPDAKKRKPAKRLAGAAAVGAAASGKAAQSLKALSKNPLAADVVAAALVATASALKDSKKARQLAEHAGDELAAIGKDSTARGKAMWQLALDIGRRTLDALDTDSAKPKSGRKAKAGRKAK